MGKTRIFIVEDERRIARFLQIELEHEGYETATEDNGLRAFERIAQEDYDLVLLDIMLPEMDGFELCRTIRKESDIPIVMLTTESQDSKKAEGKAAGATGWIVKPFRGEAVLGPFKKFCGLGKEAAASTLATIHNERFTVRLVDDIRASIETGDFDAFQEEFLGRFYAGRR